ncbi:MAG: hypothetical protein ACRC11_00405, partial [Xenococcaceae cyanobacterium]
PISSPAQKIEGVESFQQIELSLTRQEKNDSVVTQSAPLSQNPIFLAIASDWIDKKEEEKQGWSLKYQIGGDDGQEIALNAPHIYLREGVLILSPDWEKQPKQITVTFQGATIPEGISEEEAKKLKEKLTEVVAKVNIYIGYDLADSQQADS